MAFRDEFFEPAGERLQGPVTREQHKGAPAGKVEEVRDHFLEGIVIPGLPRIRQAARQIQLHLARKIKRASDLQRVDLLRIGADAPSEIGEVLAPDRERGAGHDDGMFRPKEQRAQSPGQIDGRDIETDRFAPKTGLLQPVDAVVFRLIEKCAHAGAGGRQPPGVVEQLRPRVVVFLEAACDEAERLLEREERSGK